MKLLDRPWPKGFPCRFADRAALLVNPVDRLNPREQRDFFAVQRAQKLRAGLDSIRATGIGPTYREAFFVNQADHTAVASTNAEASLLAGTNKQPFIPAGHFVTKGGEFRGISILARGVLSTTSTPTIIFQVRLGTTAGSTFLSGGSTGVSAAITTAAGVTNKWWELRLDLVCTVMGIGTGNATLSGAGYVTSPGGFASPFIYPLEPTTPDTATWTSTFDASLTQFVNLSATWSVSSSSNSITCKQLIVDAFG